MICGNRTRPSPQAEQDDILTIRTPGAIEAQDGLCETKEICRNINSAVSGNIKKDHRNMPQDDATIINDSSIKPAIITQNQKAMELGRKLVEKTDFLTKSCYPNLKPLFEVYCIHFCVK